MMIYDILKHLLCDSLTHSKILHILSPRRGCYKLVKVQQILIIVIIMYSFYTPTQIMGFISIKFHFAFTFYW